MQGMLKLSLISQVPFMLEKQSMEVVFLLELTNPGLYVSVGWIHIVKLMKKL